MYGRICRRKLVLNHCQFIYELLTFYLEQLLRNLSQKNYSTERMKRKISEQIQIRTNRRKLVLYPTKQLVLLFRRPTMNFLSYTVVEISLMKNAEKEKWINIRKKKRRELFLTHDATSHCQFTYKTLTFYLKELLRNLLRKITVLIAWRDRKVKKI